MGSFGKSNFWSIFASISVWAVAILFCLIFLQNCYRPQFFTISLADEGLSKEVEELRGVVEWNQLTVDSLNVVHLSKNIDSVSYISLKNKILREEVNAGRLMTAEQMSERITGYYDKLIDVLIFLFILFSFAGYFVIGKRFKVQYEEDRIDFAEKIKEMLMETLPYDNNLVNGIATKVHMAQQEEIQQLRDEFGEIIKKSNDDFTLLAEVYDELTEKAAFKEEIIDADGNFGRQEV